MWRVRVGVGDNCDLLRKAINLRCAVVHDSRMNHAMRTTRLWRAATALVAVLSACGDEDGRKDPSCDPDDAASCAAGLICERVGEADLQCLTPVMVSGRISDALNGAGLVGATIVGIDANGAARTRVARSGVDGKYELPVSVRRSASGAPIADAITLRVAAADHQTFATAPRSALPIDLSLAQASAGTYAIQNAATDVSLVPLPEAQRGGTTVEGTVVSGTRGGVLLLATAGSQARASAISDQDGAFVLFNVKPGTYTLEGYRAGVAFEPKPVEVASGGLSGVTLTAGSAQLSTVSGSVSLVNAPGGLTTSVILAVASTFDPLAVRGEAPAGLRVANVSGAFSFPQVPPGRYAVLAAFENDLLVRDPDEGISGTDVVFVDVGATGAAVNLDQNFKVTGALGVVSPGAAGVEQVQRGPLSLIWNDDSSEDGYELRVYDALGKLVHENNQVARVTGSATVQYALDASSFTPGMLYQFRVWSFRRDSYVSATEDLKGVFQIAR
jgi:hypothetical protein